MPEDDNRNNNNWENYERWSAENKIEHTTVGKGGFGRILLGLFWLCLAGVVYVVIRTMLGHDSGEAMLEAFIGVSGAVMAIGIGYVIYAVLFLN